MNIFRYRAALALHITNLYVRSLFSYKLGLDDLPVVSISLKLTFFIVKLIIFLLNYSKLHSFLKSILINVFEKMLN